MNDTKTRHSTIDSADAGITDIQTQSDANTSRASLGSRNLAAILRSIPTVVVLALLAGLAFWGHRNGWSLPKFSELTGAQAKNEILWCDEHGVPESECISCNAELMPKGELYGWCKEHGVHECVLDNPQIAQLREMPPVTQEDFDRAKRAIAVRPRTKNDPGCKMHLRRVQFPTIQAVDRSGIDIGLVDRGSVVETVQVTGEVVYDPTRVAQLSSRATGIVWRVEKNVGDRVRQGDVLTIVDAIDVGQAKSSLMQALLRLELDTKSVQRVKQLGGDILPEKKIEEAETARAASLVAVFNAIQKLSNLGLSIRLEDVVDQSIDDVRAQLELLGFSDVMRKSFDGSSTSPNLVPILAPRDGIVVTRDAVAGEVVDAGDSLFTIVDTTRMWLQLNVRLEEVDRISIGQKILFRVDGSEREETGNISWISTQADPETRTVQLRGELANDNGRLRNETFGSGEIILREEPDAIIVSNDAVHWEGCCNVVFVRDKDYFKDGSYKVFHTRSIRPGAQMNGYVEVIAGLLPGEVIVTRGSGVLRAELLKGNLGAG